MFLLISHIYFNIFSFYFLFFYHLKQLIVLLFLSPAHFWYFFTYPFINSVVVIPYDIFNSYILNVFYQQIYNNVFLHYFIYIFTLFSIINFELDSFLLQFFIFYFFLLFFTTNNTYYALFYLFVEVFFFGLFLGYYQADFFTAFLWLAELTIIFITIILLFYLNVDVSKNKIDISQFKFYYIGLFLFIISSFFIYKNDSNTNFFFNHLNFVDLWDDYYESFLNDSMNDFVGLFFSYYSLNNFEFILFGFLLLIASLLCVSLNLLFKKYKQVTYTNILKLLKDFNSFISSLFLRKQNIFDQSLHTASTKSFKKK